MGWKNLAGWLKGGIIALTIWVIVVIFALTFNYSNPLCKQIPIMPGLHCGFFNEFIFVILTFLSFPLMLFMRNDVGILLSSAICFFIYGAVIGWIISKIKTSKSKKQKN